MTKELANEEHQQEKLLKRIIDLFVYNSCDYYIYLDVNRQRTVNR